MISHRLKRKEKISRRASYNLIMMMAKRGNHYMEDHYHIHIRTDEDVKRLFSGGTGTFDQLVEFCRDYKNPVPTVENILGSLWVSGGTAIITSTYRNLYETASQNLARAVEGVSFSDLQSAVSSGIASIEAYINHRVEKWNSLNSSKQLVDTKNQKVSFDDKIERWIPAMTGGKGLDKSLRNWPDYKRLRGIRDNVTVHTKESSYTKSVHEIAEAIELFRTGIAGLLFQLHDLFDEKIPAIIIRDYFAPDLEIIERGY